MTAVSVSAAAITDVGLKRRANEDSVLAEYPVFVVADGMGGYEAGDLASAAVVGAFRRAVLAPGGASLDGVRRALSAAIEDVAVVAAATSRGAGSTVAGAVVVDHDGAPHWLVFNVGDSRVYRHHGSELEQLTVDHSLGQELVDAGELDPDDLQGFAQRNVITRAIGAADSTADSWLIPVTDGERLLVCSDGLSSEVSDEAIRATLTMGGRAESAAAALVQRAKRAGGRDNITVIVIDVLGGGASDGGDETTGARMHGPDTTGTLDDTTIPVRQAVPR